MRGKGKVNFKSKPGVGLKSKQKMVLLILFLLGGLFLVDLSFVQAARAPKILSSCTGITYLPPNCPAANTTIAINIDRTGATNCQGNWNNVGVLVDGQSKGVSLCYDDGVTNCSQGYHTYVNSGNGGTHTIQLTINNGECLCNIGNFEVSPAAPSGLIGSCPSPGTGANLSWNSTVGASYYSLRVDANPISWNGNCSFPNQGDFCADVYGTSYSFTTNPGTTYKWWLHSRSSAGCWSPATTGTNFTCTTPTPTLTPTPTPTPQPAPSIYHGIKTIDTGSGEKQVTYDAVGNIVGYEIDGLKTVSVTWNYAHNKPDTIVYQAPGGEEITAKYYYDGEGNRLLKHIDNNNYTLYPNVFLEKEANEGQVSWRKNIISGGKVLAFSVDSYISMTQCTNSTSTTCTQFCSSINKTCSNDCFGCNTSGIGTSIRLEGQSQCSTCDTQFTQGMCTTQGVTINCCCVSDSPTPTPTPTATPIPTPSFIPGDLDYDGDVDMDDFNKLVADFGKTGTPGFIPADIDKNGIVDIFDFNILVTNFTGTQSVD